MNPPPQSPPKGEAGEVLLIITNYAFTFAN